MHQRLGLLSVGLIVLGGCDKLLSTVDSVSILTRSPDVTNAEGMDFLLADAMPEDARQDITAVLVAVGERASATSTETPTPITGANISITWDGNSPVTLCAVPDASADGTYQANSIPGDENCGDETLTYTVGSEYTTNVETDSDAFTLKVTAPPPVDASLVEFTPQFTDQEMHLANLFHHDMSTSLTVDWQGDTAAAEKNSFVTLLRINYNGTDDDLEFYNAENWEMDPGNPIFDNAPREPSGMLELITNEPATTVTIEASSFAQEGLYVLVLTPTELSQETDGLGVASGALAGEGTAWIFWVD